MLSLCFPKASLESRIGGQELMCEVIPGSMVRKRSVVGKGGKSGKDVCVNKRVACVGNWFQS